MIDLITKLPLVVGKDVMTYFVATIEKTSAESLIRLFRNSVWKLHGLLESMILNKRLQFATDFTKELNQILGIQTKLLILFHLQTNSQTEHIN